MNKFFFKFKIVLLSFLGIGFIQGVREILVTVAALIIVLSIPDEIKTEVLVVLIIIFITFFVVGFDTNGNNDVTDKFVFKKAIGIWIATLSPYILITWFWAIVSLLIYGLFYKMISESKFSRKKIRNPKVEFLKNDVVTGVLTGIVLQIVYSGFALLPFVKMYLERQN